MSLTLPAYESLKLSIDNGISEDYHLVKLYYARYSGWFYRNRLKMAANLLGTERVSDLLEVGTGSGIFIPELLKHANKVTAIDIHETYNGVTQMLQRENVDLSRVHLQKGSILDIPFPDKTFDTVVCISVLEHFADPRPAVREMARVVKPGGALVLGFPAHNLITDTLFRLLGYSSDDIHPATHETIIAGIRDVLTVEKLRAFPFGALPLYLVCRAHPKASI